MSILLDALKRSETQRDLGRAPTLQTSMDSPGLPAGRAPSWLPGVMALVAALLIGWMGLQQFHLPDDWEETRLEAAAAAGPATAAPESAVARQTGDSKASQPANRGTSILPQLPQSGAESDAESNDSIASQRALSRGVRDYEAATAEPSDASPATRVAETRRDEAVRQSQLPRVEVAPGVRPRQGRATAAQASPEPVADQPFEPEIINYWQVPEKMREGLPDLRISVLVYSEQPENRFLLLNGERLKEGEELPNGLLLEEIRRDRAIFNYRNYRFFLKS